MRDIKVDLVDVEDESVYNKPDWTAVVYLIPAVAIVAMFAIHVIILA